MQLVVKISEDTFFDLKKKQNRTEVDNAVLNGIPLPRGHWIIHPKGIYAHLICDQCLSNAPYDIRTNFCPNCGAKMVEQKTKINEDISKGFEEFTRMMFRQGQEESEGTNADSN